MKDEIEHDDVTDAQGVAINYATLQAFNRHFHEVHLLDLGDADDEEQAAATSSYIWVRDHPEVGAKKMHEDWLDQMRAQGWSIGEFSVEERRHPHMRPWEDLPRWARRMLHLTISQIHILSAPYEDIEEVMES